jgi:hypothetical protein
LDTPGSGVRAWKLQTDPLSGEKRISAIAPDTSQINDKTLLDLKGDVEPGTEYNDTKNTPSQIAIRGKGKVDILDENPGFFKLRFTSGPLKGVWILEQEDSGSKIWEFNHPSSPGEPFEKTVFVEDGIQVWNPEQKEEGADRKQLKPLAKFAPMKPRKGFFDPNALLNQWATEEVLKGGVAVEPKWNGLRAVGESDGERELIYFEDSRDDRSKILPGIAKELKRIGSKFGPFILDAELVDMD